MDEKGFASRLLEAAGNMGLSFSADQALLCSLHVRLMLEWNERTNLTRITSERDILVKHVLDSLIPAQWLPPFGLLLDVGTGPGFPGIPLKILHPELNLVLLEAVRKKASFLTILLHRLGLKNAWALHGRWEGMSRIEHPMASKSFDVIVMRAVRLEKEHVNALAPGMLNSGGILAWWAGPAALGEIGQYENLSGRTDFAFHSVHSYELPGGSGPRHLLLWKKA
jgi:16S rRNA (guanine527-N7)-methyltransferase